MSYAYFNRFNIEMSDRMARACSQAGKDASEDVAYAVNDPWIASQLDSAGPNAIRAELREYGAWDDAELADDEANRRRILWCAACDIRENLSTIEGK